LHSYEGAGHGLYPDHQEEIQALIAEFLVRHLTLGDTEGSQPGIELARTGSGTVPLAGAGAGLVMAGVAVLVARRRRDELAGRARPTRHA
jgi:LPXTG-motif cell wall-anchored protein